MWFVPLKRMLSLGPLAGELVLITVTVKLQLVKVSQASVAVVNTVVTPTGKVLPLGGYAVTTGVLQPPLAVTV